MILATLLGDPLGNRDRQAGIYSQRRHDLLHNTCYDRQYGTADSLSLARFRPAYSTVLKSFGVCMSRTVIEY